MSAAPFLILKLAVAVLIVGLLGMFLHERAQGMHDDEDELP